MRILLVGSGAREHALAKAIRHAPRGCDLLTFGSSTNPGIADISDRYEAGNINNPAAVVRFALAGKATLAVIGPEAPLAAGCVDALREAGIPAVGPDQSMARIESSKAYARDLLARHRVPGGPRYQRFESLEGAEDFLRELGDHFVVKADGLMGGKGVKVSGDHLHSHDEALAYMQELAAAGSPWVVEEKLVGPEFSLISATDGETLVHFPAVQDHKRAFENDTGPNTGGMGSYTDTDHSLPFLEASDIETAQQINTLAARALRADHDRPYQGILYGGFMATADGVRLIEYNARFGDPECMNLLTLLESDIIDLFEGITGGHLAKVDVSFAPVATVCKYAVPEGYPDQPAKGFPIDISGVRHPEQLFLGAVDMVDGQLVGTGSRTAAVVGRGESIAAAEAAAEEEINRIKGNLFHRPDIGTAALIEQRIKLMQQLRG